MATAKRDLTDPRVQGHRTIDLTREIVVHRLMTVREVADYLQM